MPADLPVFENETDAHLAMEDRKLHYLNLSARTMSKSDRDKLNKEHADVIAHMNAQQPQPPKRVVSPPQAGGAPIQTLAELINAFDPIDIIKAAIDAVPDAEVALLAPVLAAASEKVNGMSPLDTINLIAAEMSADDLNTLFNALPDMISTAEAREGSAAGDDASDGKGDGSGEASTGVDGLPVGWEKLQWKKRVGLAVALGGKDISNAEQADAFLNDKVAAAKVEAAKGV